MKFSQHRIFELVGVLTVIISLIFVAFEIRQSNRIAIANAMLELNTMSNEVARVSHENEGMGLLLTKLSADDELSPTENQQALALVTRYTNIWNSARSLNEQGLITERDLEVRLQAIDYAFETWLGLAPHFANMINAYPIASTEPSIIIIRVVENLNRSPYSAVLN